MGVCFYCGQDNGEIVLPGRLPADAEAPRRAVWTMYPCDECKEWMVKGIILISVRVGSDEKNPHRTGGWVVVKEEAVRRIIVPEHLAETIIVRRVAFVDDETWRAVGLPVEHLQEADRRRKPLGAS